MSKNIVDFYQPNRQDSIGILVSFFVTLQKVFRAFLPLLFLIVVKFKSSIGYFGVYLIYFIVITFVFLVVYAYFNYRNFTFYIDKNINSFVITKGVFTKSQTIIQLDKIQQVNINQSFINKVLEIYSIEIDSAGSKSKEGVIPAVSLELAEQLKDTLLEHKSKENVDELDNGKNTKIKESEYSKSIGIGTLLKVGITSNYLYSIGIVIVFINTLYYRGSKIFEVFYKEDLTALVDNTVITISFVFIVLAILFFTSILVNLIRTLIRFFNYRVILKNANLYLSYGLFHSKSTIIKPTRVQIIKITRNYFQKLLKITNFKVYQVFGSDAENKKTALEIPGCSNTELSSLFKMISNNDFTLEGKERLKHNYRFFGFRFFLLVIIPLFLLYMIFNPSTTLTYLIVYGGVYFVVVTFLLWCYYKNGELILSDHFIILKSGIWDITHTIIEPNKIQKIKVTQLVWQKDYNVGSLILYTAGGVAKFSTSDYKKLCYYRDLWLANIESVNRNWM